MDYERSEYLEYLPPVFRDGSGSGLADPAFLAHFLLVFQKILTGVRGADGLEDNVRIATSPTSPAYDPVEAVIDQLDRYFDPFRTDPAFLDWLASWVALELRPDWSNSEKRKMIARMVHVWSRIGLKDGMYDLLDIYARDEIRPRVAIDDDEAVFQVVLRGDGPAQVSALAFAQVFDTGKKQVPILYRPSAIAVLPNQDSTQVRYLVADAGVVAAPSGHADASVNRPYPPPLRPGLWLLKPNGELDRSHWVQRPDFPDSLIPTALNDGEANMVLSVPVAVLGLDQDYLLVLEQGVHYTIGKAAPPCIYRYHRVINERTSVFAFNSETLPIDMILDIGGSSDVVIVLTIEGNGNPGLHIITMKDNASDQFIDLGKLNLVTPTAIVQEAPDSFVIADSCDDGTKRPGALVRVILDSQRTRILSGTVGTPDPDQHKLLIHPTSLIREADGRFLVCDTGFKTRSVAFYVRAMAEPAGLSRVTFPAVSSTRNGTATLAITRLATRGGLMNPTKLALDPQNGVILIADSGVSGVGTTVPKDAWRAVPQQFGVSALFDQGRVPENPDNSELLDSSLHGIELVIGKYKPAQSLQNWMPQT